ncbi:unnamed protein product [Rotaria sp. Silwood2]|nr:unnamed protein product [Rotaria sp. Silwood2]CAF4045552.1 unnamed protein product [Rotaria sp. Silwood2]
MAQAMFHDKVVRKRSKSSPQECQIMTTTHSPLTKTEQRSASFSNPFYKAFDYVQQKLLHKNDEQKQQFTTIQEKELKIKMLIHWLILLISFLFVIINADINKVKYSSIHKAVIEHEPHDIIMSNDSLNQSWKATTKKILIRYYKLMLKKKLIEVFYYRVTRLNGNSKKSITHDRHRRELVDTEEIWGMAKKVAITVFVLVSLCIVCCIVTTICICIKCCCGGSNNKRTRNQGFITTSQPIVIHTGSSNYPSRYNYQQAPPPHTWTSETHPMLPQPSAPPQPIDDFLMERPPPYEKICTSR